jgi:dTDP-glucose 4,6-dehydratase
MDEKNILVTGGAGFIGARFLYQLLKREEFHGNVVNFDALTYASNMDLIEPFLKDSRYTFIEGNICDKQKVRSVISAYDIDMIINFAAETHVDRSIKQPKVFVTTNLYGTFRLLEAARRKPGIHFHQISTDEVFGSCNEGALFDEKTPYDPKSPYSATKASADHMVRSYVNTYGLKATISYCSNNFGPGQNKEKFIPKIITSLLDKMSFPVYGDGMHIRDWLYVDDHIDALFLILSDEKAKDAYAISASNQMKNIDVAKQIVELYCEKENLDLEEHLSLITYIKDRPGHDFCYGIDPSKIRKDLGFKPKHDFKEALGETIDWYKSSYEEAFSTF